ncbi:MAG: flagellar basal-body rod protein FlgB [Solirubrobacteraceae bacterium]|jgi:flagellar basal-body rod protein FlgB|nr:flagellar basal-body rod protein FlgB [Solirubrobacteraceae bacterium]
MDLFDTTQTALERAMIGTGARQAALAENLANANTPGYQRRDVEFQDALRSAIGGGKQAVERSSVRTVVDTSAPLRADGSNVDVEREGAAMARAGLEHDALVSIVNTRNSILRAAMGIG